ncbi:MAG: efflux RND transporter permease subunit, partial [Chitinispirillaceae bacterium]|nr:efflux RND transporter permease subunit [Chitinispirillaceae bacterium]
MNLSKFSINRKITLIMLYLIIVGFGIFSITQLKIEFAPDLDFPIIIVYTAYSGAGPEDIENLVTRQIEEAVSATEKVKKVTSQSSEGSSLVLMEFEWGTNMKQAENDVRKNIDMIRDYLPADAREPIVIALNPSMLPVMFLSLNSPSLGPAELRKISEDRIEPLLERVEGVASVTTRGGLKRQINVRLDQIMLAAFRLTPEDVATAIQIGAGLTSSGSIKTLTKEYSLRVFSEYKSLDQIKNIVVKRMGNKIVRLKDVANVEDGFEEQNSDVRINNQQGIALIISKQSDANTVRTVKNIYKMLPKIKEILPEDCELNVVFDNAEFTQKSIDNLINTAILAFLFAVGVIYFFLRNWRGSTIMAISMPISVIATFGVLKLADLTLNIVSMAGLALAIGMLVDNSIVVLENIFRHRDNLGEDKIKSAEIGASEVGMAITASTLTTIAVFLPVLFVPGITSRLFRDMVLTISFSLGVSLIVALTLVPMMSSSLLTNGKEKMTSIQKKGIIDKFFESLNDSYRNLLEWAIHHKKIIIFSVILLFVVSIALFPFIGGEFMPKTDESRIQFTIETAAGSSLNSLRQVVMECEKIIKEEVPEVKNALFRFGAEETWRGYASSANTIRATIRLVPIEERKRSQFEIQDAIRKRLDNIPGIRYYFEGGAGPMTTAESDIEVKIIGHDLTVAQS